MADCILAFQKPMTAQSIDPTLHSLDSWLQAGRDARRHALEVLPACIRALDAPIHAWVTVAPQPQTGDGTLAGIPFAVKDIIETEGLPTEYGSALYQGRRETGDAVIVRLLRGAGAIVLGKTETAAFAYKTPAVTRNPRNLEHTPGGSSSGSAAAVAAGMIPLALGTQTLGSVLRPASYCGITGFKPTHGLFSMQGVLSMAPSLDTLGFFTDTPQDMVRLWEALAQPHGAEEDFAFGVPEPLPELEPAMTEALKRAVAALRGRGLEVRGLPITAMLDRLAEETRVVMFYEGARSHEARYRQYGDQLQDLAELVRDGLQIAEARYREALAFIAESHRRIAECYETTPVILAPAATGPAPQGLASTGDPRANSPWTALGTPALSIPMPVSGLPLGLQLTAARGQDARVLHAARRVARLL
ncbi:MAG TPA: amidase [Bryobacteraceae bacterium]|nr:amidase [Bryobacteraceae bacterium]